MATYPIKMLKDEEGTPFVPLVSADCVYTDSETTYQDALDKKLEITNLKGSDSVSITKQGNNATFKVNFGAANNIIDNLNTTVAGQGSLDARQGNVLKNMIPAIADNLTTSDANKVLSANQGKILGKRTVKDGGAAGQVLKKASDNDYDLEWGDAADPNAIVGDGSIMSIVELTYAEYKALEAANQLNPTTEYHITDASSTIDLLQETLDNLQAQINSLKTTLSGGSTDQVLSKKTDSDYDVEWVSQITPNKVLWSSDGYYMTAGHTANLSEKVSQQKNGIVLHWQAYVDGKIQNYNHYYFFIPKSHAASFSSRGVSMVMATTGFGYIAGKYLYVYDNKIVGNNDNSATGTKNGVTYNNKYWVLSEVLGV